MEQKETIAQLLKEFEVKEVYSYLEGGMVTISVCKMSLETANYTYSLFGKYGNSECMLFLDKDHTPITRENLEKLYPKWTIKDAKKGDVLFINGVVFLFDSFDHWKFLEPDNETVATAYCCIDEHGDFCTGGPDCINAKCICPATQEEKDLLFQKMDDAGYEWDSEKLELRKKKKPIKTWEDIVVEDKHGGEVYYKGETTYYATENLAKHALAEAKISQILAQGDYDADMLGRHCYIIEPIYKNGGYSDGEPLKYGITSNHGNICSLSILRFKSKESAEEFLANNRELVEQYLMIECS